MAKPSTARPVSGEIMTGGPTIGSFAFGHSREDVVDAEYMDIAAAPVVAGSGRSGWLRADQDVDGLAILSSRAEPQRFGFSERGGLAFWISGATLAAAAFWISGGHSAVMTALAARIDPAQSAITLAGVTARVDSSGSKPVIFVDGRLRNDGGERAYLPGLEIRVSDLAGLTTRYKLGTSGHSLDPGDQYAFSSRLDVPKNGVEAVAVTFAE